MGILLALIEVFDGDEPCEAALLIHQGKLFDFVLGKNCQGIFSGHSFKARDQALFRHDIFDEGGVSNFSWNKAHIPIGDDSHQQSITGDDRDTGDSEGRAQRVHIRHRFFRGDGDGVGNHSRFTALNLVDRVGLILDGEVAVQNSQPTLASHRNRHALLGHRVHR